MIKINKKLFWSKVVKTHTCWDWIGNKHTKGWGIFIQNKSSFISHRISYELFFGKINGKQIVHTCGNLSCVNPQHLYIRKNEKSITKICSNCNKEKCLDEFYISEHHKFGVGYSCKKCIGKNNKVEDKFHKKNCVFCGNEFEGIKIKHYCSIKCKKRADNIRNKEHQQEYFKRRYKKIKQKKGIRDYDKPIDSSKRNSNGQFIKGSKSSLNKHWKVRDTSKMRFNRSKNGFKKGNKIGLGKSYTKGRIGSLEERQKKRNSAQKGEKSHLWKGGLTPLKNQVRQCFKYRQWRLDIFTRDNFTCIICGKKSCKGERVYIEADHFPITFSKIFYDNKIKTVEEAVQCEEFWNINNGRTLCKGCHLKTETHGYHNKKNKNKISK